MDKHFGGVIWTNHALSRLRDRGIKQGDAWAAWRRPDQSRYAKSKDSWIYYRIIGNQKVEVLAKQNEKREWIIVSVWSSSIKKESEQNPSSTLRSLIKKVFGL